jgi:addiction module RelE/StbE family toxin
MKIRFTNHFKHSFKKLSPQIKKKTEEALTLFIENELHPQLFFHKLKGHLKDRYSVRVDFSYRMVFKIEDNIAIFIDVGDHSIYD